MAVGNRSRGTTRQTVGAGKRTPVEQGGRVALPESTHVHVLAAHDSETCDAPEGRGRAAVPTTRHLLCGKGVDHIAGVLSFREQGGLPALDARHRDPELLERKPGLDHLDRKVAHAAHGDFHLFQGPRCVPAAEHTERDRPHRDIKRESPRVVGPGLTGPAATVDPRSRKRCALLIDHASGGARTACLGGLWHHRFRSSTSMRPLPSAQGHEDLGRLPSHDRDGPGIDPVRPGQSRQQWGHSCIQHDLEGAEGIRLDDGSPELQRGVCQGKPRPGIEHHAHDPSLLTRMGHPTDCEQCTSQQGPQMACHGAASRAASMARRSSVA